MSIDRRYRLIKSSIDVLDLVSSTGATIPGALLPGGGGGSVANPTALVGLTAVNGAATTSIRSDGAPALDQSIAPTWTGIHTWRKPAITLLDVGNSNTGAVDAQITMGSASNSYLSGAVAGRAISGNAGYLVLKSVSGGALKDVLIIEDNSMVQQTFNSAAYAPTVNGVIGYQFVNASATAQTAIEFYDPNTAGAIAFGRIRMDYQGGFNYVASGVAPSHNFYRGGDAGTGVIALTLDSIGDAYLGAASSVFAGSPRRTFALNSNVAGADCLIDMQSLGTTRGYLYAAPGTFRINAYTGCNLDLWANNTVQASLTGSGLVMQGASGGGLGTGTINATGLFVNGVAVGTGTITTGSFTGTFNGGTTAPTGTCTYTKAGNSVTLYIPANSFTSNATTYSVTGLPGAIIPATQKACASSGAPLTWTNNGASDTAGAIVLTTGGISFSRGGSITAWTAAASTKASPAMTLVYDLN